MYEVLKIEERTWEKEGETQTMKSLMLEKEGSQFPTKNVALWSSHPDYGTVELGKKYNWKLEEKESATPNPHRPGTFFKNRSVINPNEAKAQTTQETPSDLESRVKKLEESVFGQEPDGEIPF